MHDLNGFEDIVTYLNYSKNEDLSYSADLNDSLTKNVFTIYFKTLLYKINFYLLNN